MIVVRDCITKYSKALNILSAYAYIFIYIWSALKLLLSVIENCFSSRNNPIHLVYTNKCLYIVTDRIVLYL